MKGIFALRGKSDSKRIREDEVPQVQQQGEVLPPQAGRGRGRLSCQTGESVGCRKVHLAEQCALGGRALDKPLPRREGAREIKAHMCLISCSLIFCQCLTSTKPLKNQRARGPHCCISQRVTQRPTAGWRSVEGRYEGQTRPSSQSPLYVRF